MESGNLVNNEILKLLPIRKIPLKTSDSYILTHFEDFNCIYVSKTPHDLEYFEMSTYKPSSKGGYDKIKTYNTYDKIPNFTDHI